MRQNSRCLVALEAKSAPIITMLVQSMYALIVLFIYIFSFITFPLTAHSGLLDNHSTCIFLTYQGYWKDLHWMCAA